MSGWLAFMQANYQTVTLEDMAEQFHLSVPYLSKFIHEKSGKTFGEQVTNIRMKKAKTLLKNGNMTVENIAAAVGYPSVEHFSRTFKKLYDKTPVEYRNKNHREYTVVLLVFSCFVFSSATFPLLVTISLFPYTSVYCRTAR